MSLVMVARLSVFRCFLDLAGVVSSTDARSLRAVLLTSFVSISTVSFRIVSMNELLGIHVSFSGVWSVAN